MRSRVVICFGMVLSVALLSSAQGQVASALVREGDPLPGDLLGTAITGIGNSATNATGGYAFTVTTDGSFSNVWGSRMGEAPTVLQAEQIIGDLTITSLESFFGISDSGDVFYGTTTTSSSSGETGLDGVFLNDTVVLNEEDAIAGLPGQFSTFNSRPGIAGNGTPYWVGGISSTQGGTSENRVLFSGVGATPVIAGGDAIAGVSELLSFGSAIDFDVRFSELASNYIMVGDVESSAANDAVVVSNGSAVSAAGSVLRESTLIPAAIGGIGDAYDNFDFLGITEAGGYMVTGDSDAASTSDEFVLIDGVIAMREGDSVGDGVLNGAIESAFLNEDGDWAAIWDYDVAGSNLEVLLVNGEPVLSEGDAVDFNGDGAIDAADNSAVVDDFNGISTLTISRRNAGGDVRAYFTADVSVGGITLEAGFEMTVSLSDVIKGDVNGDGVVNLLDVSPFIDALTSSEFIPEADTNCDGEVNLLDVASFVDLLNG